MWARSRGMIVAIVLLAGLLSGGLQPVDADTVTVRLEPGRLVGNVGDSVVITVWVDEIVNLGAFEFHLGYDPAILQATDAELGPFLTSTGRTPVPLGPALREGEIRYAGASYGTAAGADGSGALAQITFRVVGAGTSALTFNRIIVTDAVAQVLPADAIDGLFSTEPALSAPVRLPLLMR
ncbi:MAG: cohesin domain-containing protein [Anaerolineae bacterium]